MYCKKCRSMNYGTIVELCPLHETVPDLLQICRDVLRLREWVILCGGSKEPLSPIVIEQFARMQEEVDNRIRQTIRKAEQK